jgi:hypothetical protein
MDPRLNEDFLRYSLIKTSMNYLNEESKYIGKLNPEIFAKVIVVFHDELNELENKLTQIGYLIDKDGCNLITDIPLVYFKNEKGEFKEQGYQVEELDLLMERELFFKALPEIIKEIESTEISKPY